MKRYDSERHRRGSIRPKGYDNSEAGVCFVTVCTQDGVCLFGDVVHGIMPSPSLGDIVGAMKSLTALEYARGARESG
jgi:putative transposase